MAIASVTMNKAKWNEAVEIASTAIDGTDGAKVVVSETAIENTVLLLVNGAGSAATVVVKAGDGVMGVEDDLSLSIAANKTAVFMADSKYAQKDGSNRIIKLTGPSTVSVQAITKQ